VWGKEIGNVARPLLTQLASSGAIGQPNTILSTPPPVRDVPQLDELNNGTKLSIYLTQNIAWFQCKSDHFEKSQKQITTFSIHRY